MRRLLFFGLMMSSWVLLAPCAEVLATLHPGMRCKIGEPTQISFGFPLPNGHLSDPSLIRVLDQNRNEFPAKVISLLPYRNILNGDDLPWIRSVLITINHTFINRNPVSLFIDTSNTRQKTLKNTAPLKSNWVLVNEANYPKEYGIMEPPVYVTLSPAWLGDCAIKYPTVPYGTYREFSWNDTLINNQNRRWNDGQNFFKTMTNDIPGLKAPSRIELHAEGRSEPWLYDRAMTLYLMYIRSGKVEALRAAHRAAFFYGSRIDDRGYFTLNPNPDLKYSYGECLVTEFILMGDPDMVKKIRDIVKAGSTFNPDYQPYKNHGVWTERHLAFAWLTFITAFEMTGRAYYAVQARHFADLIFHHQEHPPSHRVHGPAPRDGGLMHSIEQHEGDSNEKPPYWIFSPWMTAILVDAMQRYYMHSKDPRVLNSAMRFADAIIEVANKEQKVKSENVLIPSYLASSEGTYQNSNVWSDRHHALDVAKVTAFAYHCSKLDGKPKNKYYLETTRLLKTSDSVLRDSIYPDAKLEGGPIYPLKPARKGNWWFRITSDLDFLISDQLTTTRPRSN